MKSENVVEPIEVPVVQLERKPLYWATVTILLTFFLDLFAGSIHGVATPSIIATLGGMQFYALTITTFMLGGSIGRVISGKLGDLYGRKKIYLFSLALFSIANIMSGVAQSITQLIIYKAILGIAGGFLFATCYAMVADLYTPKARVKILGYLASVIGVCYIVGPLLGGYIVDMFSWRWLYLGPVPLLIICFLAINRLLPTVKQNVKVKIDYLGILFLCGTTIPFLLALTWGGSTHPWGSTIIIGLSAISILSLCLFILVEKRASDPLLPLSILTNRYFILPTVSYCLAAFSSIMYLTYVPLFGQAVKGMSATASGSLLTPLMIALIISTQATSWIISKTGRYKAVMLFLFAWAGVMLFLVSGFNENTNLPYMYTVLCMIGISMGGFNVVFMSYLQNHLPHRQVGAATGGMVFFGNITTVISLSIAGVITNINWQVDRYLPSQLKESLSESGLSLMSSFQGLTNKVAAAQTKSQLPQELQSLFDGTILEMKHVMVQIFESMFLLSTLSCILAFLFIVLFLKEKSASNQIGGVSEDKEVIAKSV
ncbi:MFS transporter [Ammoniphilus sp. 3BR4]|uniref:MFS transporter n=1 Tax=Ammoniphilus sp. 3BR4 TaxID=3158265 RepID=UPI003466E38E